MGLTFGHKHYVPVLRWKPAEIGALSMLSEEAKTGITPLLELSPSSFDRRSTAKRKDSDPAKPEDIVAARLSDLSRAFGPRPVFVDLLHLPKSLLCSNGNDIWDALGDHGVSLGLTIIPVTGFYGKGLNYQAKMSNIARRFGSGIAIRLFRQDIENPALGVSLSRLLQVLGVGADQTHLLLDLQLIDERLINVESLMKEVPQIGEWKTLTLIAGSFPVDLSALQANNTHLLERREWRVWQNAFLGISQSTGTRLPTFGDYTIQHPIYKEPVKLPHVSASIRYTAPDYWIILRGEWIGKKNGAGSAQYPAEAQLLAERWEFCGEDFSFGDKFIAEKARNAMKPGNPKQWLMAGVNHHIVLTERMIQTGTSPIIRDIRTVEVPEDIIREPPTVEEGR